MNRFSRVFAPSLFCAVVLLSGQLSSAAAECTEEQAFNKMMAFNEAQMQFQQRALLQTGPEGQAAQRKLISIAQKSSGLGQLMAEKRWNEACAQYDTLAKDAGFDLVASGKVAPTIEELTRDGGRRGGSCDLAQSSKSFMGLHEKFSDRKANGEVTREEETAFFKAMEPLGYQMASNPGSVCDALPAIAKRFGLQYP